MCAPDDGELPVWVDRQAVVNGFAKLETIADDHKNHCAGIWRIVRSVLEENGCRCTVKKIKVRRLKSEVPDAMERQ